MGDLERKFTIFCSSAPEKQEWLEAFQKSIVWSNQRKIIGVPFDDLRASDRERTNLVPSLVEQCTSALVSSGALRKEGLIRVSAPTSEMLELTNRLNEGQDIDMRKMDPHLIVSLLKKFFRDMPECIFTSELYDKLIKLSGMWFLSWYGPLNSSDLFTAITDEGERLQEYKSAIEQLPQ